MKKIKEKVDNIFKIMTDKVWKKILICIVGFIFIPWLWWLYSILAGYWAIKNWKTNKKMVIKRLSIGVAIFVVLVTATVLVNNAYGAVSIGDVPKLTKQKTLRIEGTSSYKDGKIQITGVKSDKTISIDGTGKFSTEIELKENTNELLLEPTSKDGKKGWTKESKITLDTIAPNLDVDSLNSETETESPKQSATTGVEIPAFMDWALCSIRLQPV